MQTLIHVTDLTHTVVAIYKKHWKKFLAVLIWLIIPGALSALAPLLPTSETGSFIINNTIGIAGIIISLWLSVVLVDMFLQYSGAGRPHPRQQGGAPQGLLGRIIDLIIASLMQGIIVGVWFLPWWIVATVLISDGAAQRLQFIPWLILIGIVALVPAAFFWNRLSFARYAVLVDGKLPWSEALKTSWDLVSGRFWKIAWRWIGAFLYFGILLLLITVTIMAIIGTASGNLEAAFDGTLWWTALVGNLITILATPLFVGVGVLLYQDAKQMR